MAPFQLLIDPLLLRRHARTGGEHARYDSYPTCDYFVEAFGEQDVRHRMGSALTGEDQALSIYLHLPFCEASCRYCGCRKIAARQRERAQKYIKCLEREIRLASALAGAKRSASRLHWRCALPDTISMDAVAQLTNAMRGAFSLEPAAACVVDMEARPALPGRLPELAALGYNELSLLVQDFVLATRQTRSPAQIGDAVAQYGREARASGFRALHADVVYGHPAEHMDGFAAVLDEVIGQHPERITLEPYRVPGVATRETPRDAPGADTGEMAAQVLAVGTGKLVNAGYLHIGMTTFAKPGSTLAVARYQNRLQYGPEGFSVLPESRLLGFGPSAIGRLGSSYWQNLPDLEDYCAALNADRLPVWRGLELMPDDILRRAVIHALICNSRVSIEAIERGHLINFQRYFASELEKLARLADEGLIELNPDWIIVMPQGKLMVRAVCEVFDRQRSALRRRTAVQRI